MELLYLFLLTLFILVIIKILLPTNKNLPPSPFALPIIGHLHLFKQPLLRTVQTLSQKYGPIVFLEIGTRPVLLISSVSLVEECFTKNDVIFANRPQTVVADHVSYKYSTVVVSPYGPHWRNLRRITTIEIFSSKSLQTSSIIRREEIRSLIKNLFQSYNGGLQHFDLKLMFSKLMFNVMTRMVCGKRCFEESMDFDEQKRVHDHFKELFSPMLALGLQDFLPILRKFGLSRREKSILKLHKKRDSFLQDMINEFRKRRISSTTATADESKTIIEALLSIQEADPEHYPDEFIKGIVLTMFVAGVDTMSLTLEWAFSLLVNNPDKLHKARSEIDSHVQGHVLDDSDLTNLPYLHCIIHETLRLYPAAPLLLPHASSEDCTVGGYNIPRGTILYLNVFFYERTMKLPKSNTIMSLSVCYQITNTRNNWHINKLYN